MLNHVIKFTLYYYTNKLIIFNKTKLFQIFLFKLTITIMNNKYEFLILSTINEILKVFFDMLSKILTIN